MRTWSKRTGPHYDCEVDSGIFHGIEPAANAAILVAGATSGVALRMGISRLLLLIIAVCAIGSARAADVPEKSFELAIVKGSVPAPQRLLKVEKGDALRLRITSDAPGELHLHGYRESARLAPGQTAQLVFTAYATGRYPFEWHPVGENSTPGSRHRGAPLATLEVRPK